MQLSGIHVHFLKKDDIKSSIGYDSGKLSNIDIGPISLIVNLTDVQASRAAFQKLAEEVEAIVDWLDEVHAEEVGGE